MCVGVGAIVMVWSSSVVGGVIAFFAVIAVRQECPDAMGIANAFPGKKAQHFAQAFLVEEDSCKKGALSPIVSRVADSQH